MSVPPIPPRHLRAIYHGPDRAVEQKEPIMLKIAYAAAAIIAVANVAGTAKAADPDDIEALVAPCRAALRLSFKIKTTAPMNSYVKFLLSDPERYQRQLIACAAYLAGVRDADQGTVKPVAVVENEAKPGKRK